MPGWVFGPFLTRPPRLLSPLRDMWQSTAPSAHLSPPGRMPAICKAQSDEHVVVTAFFPPTPSLSVFKRLAREQTFRSDYKCFLAIVTVNFSLPEVLLLPQEMRGRPETRLFTERAWGEIRGTFSTHPFCFPTLSPQVIPQVGKTLEKNCCIWAVLAFWVPYLPRAACHSS